MTSVATVTRARGWWTNSRLSNASLFPSPLTDKNPRGPTPTGILYSSFRIWNLLLRKNRKFTDIYTYYFKSPVWLVNFQLSPHTTLESGIFIKNHGIWNLALKFSWCWTPRKNQESTLHYFHDTDDPMIIYGHSGKLCHMLSVTLTIQQPPLVDFGYHREFSCHTRTFKASGSFLLFIRKKWQFNKTSRQCGASLTLVTQYLVYYICNETDPTAGQLVDWYDQNCHKFNLREPNFNGACPRPPIFSMHFTQCYCLGLKIYPLLLYAVGLQILKQE